jgi:hypothetical protein
MRETGLNRRATEFRTRQGTHSPARSGASSREARAGSGLARAAELRLRFGPVEDSSTIISADDRRNIQGEIDEVSRRNRIAARAEDFIVKPRRKGFVFPLAVNLMAIAVTIGAVLALSQLFGRRDLAISESAASMDTAEGKLLSEYRRDSESKLLEKDKAIADFRSRILSLDKERSDLAANIDEKVKAREADLRSGLQSALDAEKKRLADQGLSATALQARLRSYEAERTAAFDKQLADSRKQAAVEKSAAEDRFSQLKDEYQKSIAGLGDERKRIEDEAKKSEESLRLSMDAKNKQLESQSSAARAGLDQARTELASLEAEQSKAKAEEDRVIGLYGTIRVALQDRRYEDAAAGADALASYLKDPSLLPNASIQDRRNADLFVAETLGSYARDELERAAVDSGKLLAQAELLASARDAVAAAQAALKAGNAPLAQAKYREALGKVPEILVAHEYFLDQLQASEAARRATLSDALAAANRDLDAVRGSNQSTARAAEAKSGENAAELLAVKKELAAAQEAARSASQSAGELAAAKKTEEGLKADIAALNQQLAQTQERTAEAAAAVDPAVDKAAIAAQAGELSKLKDEVGRLSAVAAKQDSLVSSYNSYLASDASAPRSAGPDELIAANARLDSFLGGAEASESLPGLRERVTRLEKAFQEAGQREVLFNALDIVDGAASAKGADARDRYFKDIESRYAADTAMLGFIAGLRKSFGK